MTDAQWRCLHSFLSTGPDVRVGKETHTDPMVALANDRGATPQSQPMHNTFKWAERDLNPRPPRCKRGALTN